MVHFMYCMKHIHAVNTCENHLEASQIEMLLYILSSHAVCVHSVADLLLARIVIHKFQMMQEILYLSVQFIKRIRFNEFSNRLDKQTKKMAD